MKLKVIAYGFIAIVLAVIVCAFVAYLSAPADSAFGPPSIEAAEEWIDTTPYPGSSYKERSYQSWLKGSTAISVAYNPNATYGLDLDQAIIWYETASNVWAMTGTYTLSDGVGTDSVLDTIAVTASGGATAGGKYYIRYWNYWRL